MLIPDSVAKIGDYAFQGCTNITSVTIPANVKTIGNHAFYNCNKLRYIFVETGVETIGEYAFAYCSANTIIIPNSVTSIGNGAFNGCGNLKSVTIGKGINVIKTDTFGECSNLATIKIGNNLETIDKNAFTGISNIPDVYYEGSEAEWKNIAIDLTNDKIIWGNMYYNADITHEHVYTEEITKQATCTETGIKVFTCECGKRYTETIPATGHIIAIDKAAVPTCTKSGKTEGKHCSVCKTVFVAQQTLSAKGHTYKTTTTVATAAKDGKIVTACTVCGKISKTVVIPKIASISLSSTSYTYDGKVKTPSVTVKDSKGKTLKNGTDYTVAYASGRKTPGQYAVKITFKGNYSGSKTLYFTILPGVTSKIATATNSSAVKIAWKAVPGATGYRVYQYDAKTKKYVTLKTTTATSYTVTKLKSGTSYKFAVKAYSTVNGKVFWASGYKTITATTNPGTPTLKVTAGSKKAALSWNKQTGATGYVVYMATSNNGKYSKIATLKGNSSVTYTKTGLTKGKIYYFKVAAYTVANGKTLYSSFSSVKAVKIK